MKRSLGIAAAIVVLAAAAIGVWWFLHRGPSGVAQFAELFPTGPIACPQDPNDLAGIEGYAPGAGSTEKIGQTGTGNIGAMSGGLAGTTPETPNPATSKTCTGLSSRVTAYFDALDERAKLVPSEGFDPAARATTLADAGAIFAFVRDNIHTEAYPGAMRGASGTLQSHGGSPADKALLLAALLTQKQIPVRFVHAPLSDGEVADVIKAVDAPLPSPQPQNLDAQFKQLGVDPAQARSDAGALRDRAEATADSVISSAKTPTDDLLAALQGKSIGLGSDGSLLRKQWATNVRDHWWVQAQENGQWVDLDPTLAATSGGSHLGAAPAGDSSDTLPDSAIGTLTVRLVEQKLAGGTLADTTLVTQTVKLTDTYAVPIIASIGDRSIGSDKLAQASSFTPSIDVGDDNHIDGDAFSTDGLATIRLEITTQQPGVAPLTQSRIVLDRRTTNGKQLDPAWTSERTAYALTSVFDILPVAGEIDPAFAGLREIAGMRNVRAFMAYAAAGGNGRQMPPTGIAEPYPLEALRYFEYDSLVRRRLENENAAARLAFDRPQIALEHRGFALVGGKPAGIDEFDIVDNGMAAAGTDAGASARANFTRGYVDTYSEQHLVAAPNVGGTIALFEAAKSGGVPIDVLQGSTYGGTAIAPHSAVQVAGEPRTGWWQVDPQSGNLVGRMGPSGAGQELAEYAIARSGDWSTLYAMIQFYGDFFRCIAGAVEAPLAGDQTQAQENFKSCAGAAICSYAEALSTSEAFSRWGSDEEALIYNIFDLSVPGTKDSWSPSLGAACGGVFHSPLYP